MSFRTRIATAVDWPVRDISTLNATRKAPSAALRSRIFVVLLLPARLAFGYDRENG